jgi:hypothetical protein
MKRLIFVIVLCLMLSEAFAFGTGSAATIFKQKWLELTEYVFADSVGLNDTNSTNQLWLKWDDDDTSDRVLKFKVASDDRTLTLSGDAALNQNLRTTDKVTFESLISTVLRLTQTEGTIEEGVLVFTGSNMKVTSQEGTADDIDRIWRSGGTSGDILVIIPSDSDQDITLKHGSGDSYILTPNGVDYTIPDDGTALLIYNGTEWVLMNSGSGFPLPNDDYATWRNAADTADIGAIKVDGSNNTILAANGTDVMTMTSTSITPEVDVNIDVIQSENNPGEIIVYNIEADGTDAEGKAHGGAFAVANTEMIEFRRKSDNAGNLIYPYVKITADTTDVSGDLFVGGEMSAFVSEDTDSDKDDVLVTTISNSDYGMIIVRETAGTEACLYLIAGGTIEKISTDATFTVTKDNASTYNVYFENNVIKVQNKVGDDKDIRVGLFGIN